MSKETRDESPPRIITTQAVLERVDSLPTLPVVALRVGELVNDPNASAGDIARVMRADPSLSAKVLQLVNSAYFSIPGGVADVQRAISFIGFNTLHQLVLSVSVLRALQTPRGSRFDARGLWLHSLGVATCSRTIARHIRFRDDATCFTAGLLHDVGKIALAIAAPEAFGAAIDDASTNGVLMADAERSAGLPDHNKVGGRLAKKWRFPAPLLAAIEHHHSSDNPAVRRGLSKTLQTSVDIVAVSDELVRSYDIGNSGSPPCENIDPTLLDRAGLSAQQERVIYTDLMRELEVSKVFLQLLDGQEPETKNDASGEGSRLGTVTVNRAPRSGSRQY